MAKSQTLDEKIYLICNYTKKIFRSLRLRHLPPFDWKFLSIGILRAKDLRKNVLIFLGGGLTPAPLALLVIRVVLLQWLYGVSNRFCPQLYVYLKDRVNHLKEDSCKCVNVWSFGAKAAKWIYTARAWDNNLPLIDLSQKNETPHKRFHSTVKKSSSRNNR